MNEALSWLAGNYVEVIAASLGLLAIILQIRQHILYWPVSIILVSLYIFVYINARLYADMSLQVYYLVISFYGWYHWTFGKRKHNTLKLPVTFASPKLLGLLLLTATFLFFLIAAILIFFTDSDLPWWDAFTTALSFIATWMLARKIIENWLIWIIVDAVSAGIYIYKELYPTTILFIVLTILAFTGYQTWRKDARNPL